MNPNVDPDAGPLIVSFCDGERYEKIKSHWVQRVLDKCGDNQPIQVLHSDPELRRLMRIDADYAWWDVERMKSVLSTLKKGRIAIHIDMDIILEKNVLPLADLPYDLIISREIGGANAYPTECSQKLGFGMCSGFYIAKPTANRFLEHIFTLMKRRVYGNYSDQVALMNYISNDPRYSMREEPCTYDDRVYINNIIKLGGIDEISICVLDFDIVTRDPILNDQQFANHINIDNVGGEDEFIRYFYNNLEALPLTCRCGKEHLGNTDECSHIAMRNNDI